MLIGETQAVMGLCVYTVGLFKIEAFLFRQMRVRRMTEKWQNLSPEHLFLVAPVWIQVPFSICHLNLGAASTCLSANYSRKCTRKLKKRRRICTHFLPQSISLWWCWSDMIWYESFSVFGVTRALVALQNTLLLIPSGISVSSDKEAVYRCG